jgi:hypothetical protein
MVDECWDASVGFKRICGGGGGGGEYEDERLTTFFLQRRTDEVGIE